MRRGRGLLHLLRPFVGTSEGADLTQARDSDSIRPAHTACSARGSRPRGADLQKPPRCATAGGFVTNQRSAQSLFDFAIPASIRRQLPAVGRQVDALSNRFAT
jgi:hypothetical protein